MISSIVNKDVCVIGNIKKMNVHSRDTAPLSVVNFCGVGHHEDIRFIRFLYLEVIPKLTWTSENIWTARLIYHLVCQFTISDQNVTFDQSSFDGRSLSTSSTMSNVTDTYLLTTYLLTYLRTYLRTYLPTHFTICYWNDTFIKAFRMENP